MGVVGEPTLRPSEAAARGAAFLLALASICLAPLLARASGADSHLCYKVSVADGTARFGGGTIRLIDPLEDKSFAVKRMRHLCTPVRVNSTEVVDPDIHLASHRIQRVSGEAQHVERKGILTQSPFGELMVDTVREDLLLTPSAICIDEPAGSCPHPLAAPDPLEHGVDSFKCYRVRTRRRTPRFEGTTVTLADSLTAGTRSFDLTAVRHLCLAADWNGEGVKRPEAQLLCYRAKRTRGEGQLDLPSAVAVTDRTGTGELYLADQLNGRIQVFALDGTFLRTHGSRVESFSGDWKGKFGKLQSLALDAQGRLHAADAPENRIQVLDADTGSDIDDYGELGRKPGELKVPLDLWIMTDGAVAVANWGNHRVEIVHTVREP